MATTSRINRIDTASRVILATPQAIFRAMTDQESVASWRPPKGKHARIEAFDPRPGGGYRMAFIHDRPTLALYGKPITREDWFTGHFAELVPFERIVEDIVFDSDDSGFAVTMRITTELAPVADGTRVTFTFENVPPGIDADVHRAGMASILSNLAAFIE